jgi:3'(2'), 5'-bisphosphate nucleotidase
MIEHVVKLARKAGELILPIYAREVKVALKEDRSPLTEADQASHHFLDGELRGIIQGCPVVSEESAETHGLDASETTQFWLIDPLDGTKEFLKKSGEFTVNIALIRDRRPVLGVVHAPATGVTYWAVAGEGAFRVRPAGAVESIRTRQARTEALSVVASKDHAGPMVAQMLERIGNAKLASIGSSLKFCLVADGTADIYLRDVPTMEWDTAAAQCVVEEAGGVLLTLDGRALSYGKPGMKNGSLLTLGDPRFPWRSFVPVDPSA